MAMTRSTLLLCLGVLPACGSTPDGRLGPAIMTEQRAPTPSESATTVSSSGPSAVAPTPASQRGKWADLEASPGAAELEPGAAFITSSEWTKARAALPSALEKIRATAPLDVVFAGEALLGRACAEVNDTACAEKHYGAIVAAWTGAETARAISDAAGPDAGSKEQHLERALLAVGEALFFGGEQKRAAADRVTMPTYKGDGSRDSVSKFIRDKVGPWVTARQAAVQDAENAYSTIAALEPKAPPRWVVRGSSRVGVLWAKFTAEFRAAPIPNQWSQSGTLPGNTGMTWADVRDLYYEALDQASAPQQSIARAAFEKCHSDSSRFGYADDYSKTCDAWLEKSR
jgi:hypothetical protein